MASRSQQQPDLQGDPLLAEALDTCLRLEQVQPGSSADAVETAPAYLQPELQRLIEDARALRAVTQALAPAAEFRDAARARLVATLAADSEPAVLPFVAPGGGGWRSRLSWSRGGSAWLKAAAACLVAIAVVSYTTISASAGALPGDPLYGVKLTRESAAVRLESNPVARASLLLDQADVRLGELDRLIQEQRLAEVASTADRYAAALAEATDALASASPADRSAALAQFQTHMDGQRMRLEALVRDAPPAAAPALRNALAAANQAVGQMGGSGAAEARALATETPAAATQAPAAPTIVPTVAPGLQASPGASVVPPNRAPAASPIASVRPTVGVGPLSVTPAPSGSAPTERATPEARPTPEPRATPERATPEPAAGTPQAAPSKPPAQR
ncbi:MAG: DUF5667 domain-containing protein [Chloroflexota bacterium]|nr:DUF5667 domain-containing protein [Chloroflexota bacterium]